MNALQIYIKTKKYTIIQLDCQCMPFAFNNVLYSSILSAMLSQWGESSPLERTVLGSNPARPDNTYTLFCRLECPYKMNLFRDYSVYLCA